MAEQQTDLELWDGEHALTIWRRSSRCWAQCWWSPSCISRVEILRP